MTTYFSPPSDHLDPALFDSDHIKDEVRQPLIDAAELYLRKAGLRRPKDWLRMWLTGSAISYQWDDKQGGDLDVQIGMQYESFLSANPGYQNVGEYDIVDKINRYLKENLWPNMNHAIFSGKQFEVTFFWNYGVHEDILSINPYAAYDLMNNTWIVHPPLLPADPTSLYSPSWYESTKPDTQASQRLLQRHLELSESESRSPVGSPLWINAQAGKRLVESQARSLFDEIHGGRHEAFSYGGKGYGDYHNFRWQQAKATGTLERLHKVISSMEPARDAYGNPIKSAQEVLEEAMTFRLGKRYS